MRQIEKNKKDYYLHRRVKYFFNAKLGFNLDILLIEQVILVYKAENEFAASDKKIYLLHSHN